MEKLKGFLLGTSLWVALIMLGSAGVAKANYVTMDVDKWNGASGTYQCKDVVTCWKHVRDAEARGSTYYCNSVAIKRNGKIVWYKNFYTNVKASTYDFPLNKK